MNIIYWEILQGVVDWVNNVFTTQKNISSIVEINIGWLPTIAYAQSWRTITFDSAPLSWTESPTIDYYWEEVCTFTDDVITLWNVLDDVLGVIWITQWSSPYPQAIAIKQINNAYKQTINTIGMQVKGNLSFTKWGSYSYGEFTRLDLVTTTSPMNNFVPRTWRIMIDNSVVEYNTRTDSSFTLTSPSLFTPETNANITIGYKLPSCVRDAHRVMVDGLEYSRVEQDSFNWINNSPIFTIVDWYVYFWNYKDTGVVNISYLTKFNKFVDSADEIDIDSEFSWALSDFAAAYMLTNREDERWQVVEKRANVVRKKWAAFINRQKKGGKVSPFFSWPLDVI